MKKNIPISFLIIFLLIITISCSRNQENSGIQNIDAINAKKNIKSDSVVVFDTIAGKKVYESKCMVCHQENGMGVTGTFPPLAGSDYLLFDKKRALKNIMHGVKDSIVVNGQTYRGNIMPDIELTDEQIKDVANYILNSWGNKGGTVSIEDVKTAKNK
jgi:mono/diheme cytochrome c family protein